MKIRNRIAIQFTLIVATILIVFSGLVYTVSSDFREEEFYDRLKNKARTTCQFLVKVQEIDATLLKIIDSNTLTTLNDERIVVFNQHNEIIYTTADQPSINYDHNLLNKIRGLKELETYQGKDQVLGLLYEEGNEPLIVLAAAYDQFGHNKLLNLRNTLAWSLLIGMGMTILLSVYFAGNALKPIADINGQVTTITALNLKHRLQEANSPDEIGQLATNFNIVLEKLELAFDQQRSFVYHASHELRTPLAALKSEIQLAQHQLKDQPDIREVLFNLSTDIERLIGITNSLLFLARSFEDLGRLQMKPVRIDELVFLAREELYTTHPEYTIAIDYSNLPESENHTLIQGNEALLKRVFLNLFDNACKYSPDRSARVLITTDTAFCAISVSDTGIGIAPDDLPHIFEPFYRTPNASDYSGYGIGLSVCHRITEAHNGRIYVTSAPDEGSTFRLKLPHI